VISNNAAARYKLLIRPEAKMYRNVGRELRVQAILIGKVTQQDSRMQVRVDLVDAQNSTFQSLDEGAKYEGFYLTLSSALI
jgi:TolB-like protein